jgi:hypothetical protein
MAAHSNHITLAIETRTGWGGRKFWQLVRPFSSLNEQIFRIINFVNISCVDDFCIAKSIFVEFFIDNVHGM